MFRKVNIGKKPRTTRHSPTQMDPLVLTKQTARGTGRRYSPGSIDSVPLIHSFLFIHFLHQKTPAFRLTLILVSGDLHYLK
jgi:hypothetical protein